MLNASDQMSKEMQENLRWLCKMFPPKDIQHFNNWQKFPVHRPTFREEWTSKLINTEIVK